MAIQGLAGLQKKTAPQVDSRLYRTQPLGSPAAVPQNTESFALRPERVLLFEGQVAKGSLGGHLFRLGGEDRSVSQLQGKLVEGLLWLLLDLMVRDLAVRFTDTLLLHGLANSDTLIVQVNEVLVA